MCRAIADADSETRGLAESWLYKIPRLARPVGPIASKTAAPKYSYAGYSHASIGLLAVSRPMRATFSMFLVASLRAQRAQLTLLSWMVFPHPAQIFSVRCATGATISGDMPFASRRCACVKCVGARLLRVRFWVVDQNCLATHSATGATARLQIDAVSERRMVTEPVGASHLRTGLGRS
jgi:hypothetical protein